MIMNLNYAPPTVLRSNLNVTSKPRYSSYRGCTNCTYFVYFNASLIYDFSQTQFATPHSKYRAQHCKPGYDASSRPNIVSTCTICLPVLRSRFIRRTSRPDESLRLADKEIVQRRKWRSYLAFDKSWSKTSSSFKF